MIQMLNMIGYDTRIFFNSVLYIMLVWINPYGVVHGFVFLFLSVRDDLV